MILYSDICDDVDVDSDSSDTDSEEGESDTETSATPVPPTTPRSRRKIQEAADMVSEIFCLSSCLLQVKLILNAVSICGLSLLLFLLPTVSYGNIYMHDEYLFELFMKFLQFWFGLFPSIQRKCNNTWKSFKLIVT